MSAIDPGLRILEIGEFSLFKRCFPAQTTFVFTGSNPRGLPGIEGRPFSPLLALEIARGMRRREWDLVVCFVPALPLWDCRRGVTGLLSAISRLIFRFRSVGTAIARGSPIPLVAIDSNDALNVSVPGLALLDRSILYFKRELPLDPAKALFDVAPRFRTHKRVMASPFWERNRLKFRPVSSGVPEATVELAKDLSPQKAVDVFFAGSPMNSEIRRRGFEELQALGERGIVVDVSTGGLAKRDYLERCARAWLTWSPEGYGWECLRHYEASLCGSVPVLSTPGIKRYAPLEAGIHAHVYPDRPGGLLEAVTRALSDKAELEAMAGRAREHVLSHHSHKRLCEYIVSSSLDLIHNRTTT